MDATKRLALFATFIVLLGSMVCAEEVTALPNDDEETIIERDAAGRVRVEHQVALDRNENFVSHGAYNIYDESGVLVGGGAYAWGRKTGPWKRVFKS